MYWEKSEKLVKEIIKKYYAQEQESNDLLYHYTHVPGFHGIMESKVLQASNIAFLNDYLEINYGCNLAQKRIKSLINEFNNSEIEAHKIAVEFFKELKDRLYEEFFKEGSYVFSFCENGDLLSQWRGYSRGTAGISIGFNLAELKLLCEPSIDLLPIQYKIKEQEEILEDILVRVSALEYSHLDDHDYTLQDKINLNPSIIMRYS